MSALRYSGELRIRVTYLEPCNPPAFSRKRRVSGNGEYRCLIRHAGESAGFDVPASVTVYVGAPAVAPPVDSPEAFDTAAHAALSFADDDGWPIGEHAALTTTGIWHIGRSPAKAWPVEAKHDTIQSPPPDECLPPVLDPSEVR